jgi:hypothetical protein
MSLLSLIAFGFAAGAAREGTIVRFWLHIVGDVKAAAFKGKTCAAAKASFQAVFSAMLTVSEGIIRDFLKDFAFSFAIFAMIIVSWHR